MAVEHRGVEDLALELTKALGIPFRATTKGAVAFDEPLDLSDWSVPLVFDGHLVGDDEDLVPSTPVGHLLWPHLRPKRGRGSRRPQWYCALSPRVAAAVAEALRDDTTDPGWIIGDDVLLKDDLVPATARARRAS